MLTKHAVEHSSVSVCRRQRRHDHIERRTAYTQVTYLELITVHRVLLLWNLTM